MGTPSPNPWDVSLSAGIDGGQRSEDPAPLNPGTETALGFHPWRALSSAQPFPIVYLISVPHHAKPIDPPRSPLKTHLSFCPTLGVHFNELGHIFGGFADDTNNYNMSMGFTKTVLRDCFDIFAVKP